MSVKSSVRSKTGTSPVLLAVAVVLLGIAAWVFYRFNQYTRAMADLQTGEQALAQDDFDAARKHLQDCLNLRPDTAEAHLLMGRLARRVDLDRREDHEEEAQEQYRLYKEYGGAAAMVDMERLMLRAQKGELRSPARGDELLPVGSPISVEGIVDAFAKKAPSEQALALEALVSGCMRTMRLPQALGYLDRWLKEKPNNPRALQWKGETLALLEKEPEAIQVYRQLVATAPANEKGRLSLAETLFESTQPAQALDQFENVASRNPSSVQAVLGEARCLLALDRADEAKKALDGVPADKADSAAVLVLEGQIELARKQPDKAEPWFRRAILVTPDDRELLANLALCLTRLNRLTEAQTYQDKVNAIDRQHKALKQVLQKVIASPNKAAPRCQAAEVFFKAGDDKEGMRWLDSARREEPQSPDVHRVYARYYRDHGQPELAKEHEKLLPKKP